MPKVPKIDQGKSKVLSGTIVQWDGGIDNITKDVNGCRISSVDANGYVFKPNYKPTETAYGYWLNLAEIFKITRPSLILGDNRANNNPRFLKASVFAILGQLNIMMFTSSDANIKVLCGKNHGLIRSKFALKFSKKNIKSISGANKIVDLINKQFNNKYGYKKPSYNGEKVTKEIINFITWKNFEAIVRCSNSFINFQNNGYQMFENGKPMTFETNVAYPVGEKDGVVKCLYKNKLYTLQKINRLNLTAKEFANGLLRDKFKQNTILTVTKESMIYWMELERISLTHFLTKKIKKEYQEKMSSMALEIFELKDKISTFKKSKKFIKNNIFLSIKNLS